MPIPRHSALNVSIPCGEHNIWEHSGTFCRRRCSESRGFFTHWEPWLSHRFTFLGDYQCFGWCFGLFAFLGGAVFVVVCCLVSWLVFPIYEYGMHKYVVISKTVTIVTMSAAMEQKKEEVKDSFKDKQILSSLNLHVQASTIILFRNQGNLNDPNESFHQPNRKNKCNYLYKREEYTHC